MRPAFVCRALVTATSTVYSGDFEFQSSVSNLTAVSTDQLAKTIILRLDAGRGQPE